MGSCSVNNKALCNGPHIHLIKVNFNFNGMGFSKIKHANGGIIEGFSPLQIVALTYWTITKDDRKCSNDKMNLRYFGNFI